MTSTNSEQLAGAIEGVSGYYDDPRGHRRDHRVAPHHNQQSVRNSIVTNCSS